MSSLFWLCLYVNGLFFFFFFLLSSYFVNLQFSIVGLSVNSYRADLGVFMSW